MAKRKSNNETNSGMAAGKQPSVSLKISERGLATSQDFASFMSALMGDLVAGRISPMVGNAACNAGGKLLKVVEMQLKYGVSSASQNGAKVLMLTGSPAPMLETDKVQ